MAFLSGLQIQIAEAIRIMEKQLINNSFYFINVRRYFQFEFIISKIIT